MRRAVMGRFQRGQRLATDKLRSGTQLNAVSRMGMFTAARPMISSNKLVSSQKRYCSGPRRQEKIRNVGVIAHVDHGKTTLVDALLQQSGHVKIEGNARVMDSNDIEQERGITILAKNTCINLPDHKINIVDTPGHSDFSGEVERGLQMVEGFILLVDAAEGPRPGTRYVLRKALELDLKPIVVINKIDRTTLDKIENTCDEIESLFLELAIDEHQLNYPVIYGSGRSGYMSTDPECREGTLQPLFDCIIKEIPPPKETSADAFQAVIQSIEVDNKKRKEVTLRVMSGEIALKDDLIITDYHNEGFATDAFKLRDIFGFQGLDKVPQTTASFGDIITISEGLDKLPFSIGMTVNKKGSPAPLPYKALDEPTFAVTMHPSRSPVAGTDGSIVGGNEIRARLQKEVVRNLAMKLNVKGPDEFEVKGRGLLHLGILFEEMRREGFEIEMSKPGVLYKEIDGKKHEPWEQVTIRTESDNGPAIDSLMYASNAEAVETIDQDDWVVSIWNIPSRFFMGMGRKIINATSNSTEVEMSFLEYRPFNTSWNTDRTDGCLISSGAGEVSTDGLNSIAKHGVSFVQEKFKTYEGMVVGKRNGPGDLVINVTKPSTGWNTNQRQPQYSVHSLESALQYIQEGELVEITPTAVRIRKLKQFIKK
eukprot:TRINITY_DN6495_c0_g2_i1.p1 TRINITY_DN6495_c0_g2~~TRINITY_DN6495_c0_g2_i1.p1  ORF type:complete len:652 (+),score=145.53 TRINITY_DN6495_c0_g2_i1:51-2006(+)